MRRWVLIASTGLIPAPLALIGWLAPGPLALWNSSPSEPVGLYVRDRAAPAVGRLIAFRPPPDAWPYVGQTMPERARTSILKTVVASRGDLVCARDARLRLNGRDIAPIAARDRLGRALPHWTGCRRLGVDEFFVYSARIANSFDSRYYGPVRRRDVIGVYRPVGRVRWALVGARGA